VQTLQQAKKNLTESHSRTHCLRRKLVQRRISRTQVFRVQSKSKMSATLEMETLMTTLRGATDEQWLAFMKLINEHGVPQFFASVDPKKAAAMAEEADEAAAAVAAPKKAVAKKEPKEPKEPKAKKAPAEVAPMPETEDGSAPDASEYRVSEADIDHSVCIGRAKDDDKRWSPIIFRERQCGKKLEEGSDLCKTCHTREGKYAESSSPKIGWMGRVTEEPLDWVHMLGTTWAEEKKPKFNGSSSAASVASDAASDSGASEEMEKPEEKKVVAKKEKVPAADKEAKKAAAAAEREAAAAAKKAAKEAETAAKKEAAAAAAAAKKEAKEAETAAKKAAKPAAKPKAAKAEKVADASVPAVTVKANIEIIGDEFYETKDGNVYEWDGEGNAGMGKRGDYVGRLLGTKGDYSIDSDAAEVL